MRIVHISDCYLPRLGGIEMQVDGLARAQVAAGHEVHIITATAATADGDDLFETAGIHLHRVVSSLPVDLPIHVNGRREIRALLREISPEVVHIHMGAISQFAWVGISAVHDVKIPSLTTVHSMWAGWTRQIYRVLKYINGWHRKTTLSAVSEAAAALIHQTTSARVLITNNGVDLSHWFADANTSVHSPLRLACASRFARRKRVLPLLQLMKSVHDSLGDLTPHLTIAGNGPQFDKAHEFIASNQLQNVVTLAGRLDRAGLKNLFTQSDIFIQLSELEAFGIAAIEARAAGLAILGRADNGLSEFVTHGHTGYLESSDITVAARLIELVENPERVAEMKNQSRTSRPVQSWDFALAQTDDCYRTAQRLR